MISSPILIHSLLQSLARFADLEIPCMSSPLDQIVYRMTSIGIDYHQPILQISVLFQPTPNLFLVRIDWYFVVLLVLHHYAAALPASSARSCTCLLQLVSMVDIFLRRLIGVERRIREVDLSSSK